MKRSAGILLPIFSLPSKYGIGSLGEQAKNFVDFLVSSKQSYWQILPIGPTSYGDSPYGSFSSFAGNPYFIDLDILVQKGLLEEIDLKKESMNITASIDYARLFTSRFTLLHKAYERFNSNDKRYKEFCKKNKYWLNDYVLFMALKQHFEYKSWLLWPDQAIRLRKQSAIRKYQTLLKEDIGFYKFLQYEFFQQYSSLKEYANNKGIQIIGDLPIYAAMDSCDVWANPKYYLLDQNYYPTKVAGVPPDYFNANGQLWGNPIYDWKYIKKDNYAWWIKRIEANILHFDIVRLDHFRGFASYWQVNADEETAINGQWQPGPAEDFYQKVLKKFNSEHFIAEDLGLISDDVKQLLSLTKIAGMRVMEFGLEANNINTNTPINYITHSVCYTSTHDNMPLVGWLKQQKASDIEYIKQYFQQYQDTELYWSIICGGMASKSNLFVCQMQDYLGLGVEGRINFPGTDTGNWTFRLSNQQLSTTMAQAIAELVISHNR